MATTSRMEKADRETDPSKRRLKQNWNQPPSRHQVILSHNPTRFTAGGQQCPPCSRGGCWCLLTLPFLLPGTRRHKLHAHIPARPRFTWESCSTLTWGGLIYRCLFQPSGISTFLNNNWFLTHVACVLHRPGAPLQTQTPACSILPLVAPNTASVISVQEKNRRNTVFRQMSKQFFSPRNGLPDCPAGFVILRAQHNSIRINFVIR